jgi:hypothetical protein
LLAHAITRRSPPQRVAPGEKIVWDRDRGCFHVFRAAAEPQLADCVTQADGRPPIRFDLERQQDSTTQEKVSGATTVLTTNGPVHPNLFGHCNYAAAIVSEIVAVNHNGPQQTRPR